MEPPEFGIRGQTAIVTGASRGIGRGIAESLAAAGVDVGICSRELDRIAPVAEEISTTAAADAVGIECDVTDRNAVERFVQETESAFGSIDILVNNAGGQFTAPFEEISPNGWNAVLDLNLTGTVHCMQVVGERMRSADGGSIVNIASVGGLHPAPGESHYAAAKAAVIRLTETIAVEWAENEIRVNAIAPGLIQTAGVAETLGIESDELPPREQVDRRIGYPSDIADVVHFLVSPAAAFITGQTLTAKGVPRPGNPEISEVAKD